MKTPEQITEEALAEHGYSDPRTNSPESSFARDVATYAVEADREQRAKQDAFNALRRIDEEMERGIGVTTFTGDDEAHVVQIDTSEHTGRLRVNLNDGPPLYDGDPEKDDARQPIPFDTLDRMLSSWADYDGDVAAFMEAWLAHFNEGAELPDWATA